MNPLLDGSSGETADALLFESYGDSALLVRGNTDDHDRRWALVHALAASVRGAQLVGVRGIVATFETLLVEYDPLHTDAESLRRWIQDRAPARDLPMTTGRVVEIPVAYGGSFGPDLGPVAHDLGITPAEVIERHAATTWRVAFNGAPAGAPLHEGAAFDLPVPRMPEPRVRIPAGTIAVSGAQGTIYTIPAPGGWRLIGRTPLRIVNPNDDAFVAICPGDELLFRPISAREFEEVPQRFIGELL